MPQKTDDLSLFLRVIRSEWFRALWRMTIVIGGFVVTGIGAYIMANTTMVRQDVDRLQSDVTELRKVVDQIEDISASVGTLSEDLTAVRLDTATMRGILQEMRRQDVARSSSPFTAPFD